MRKRHGTEQARKPRMTRANVKRYVGVAGVILPAVTPLLYQGAAEIRGRWDQQRARRLGVPADRLGEFTGRGAALHARLAGLTDSLAALRERHPDRAEFVDTRGRRLTDLAAAVRAAEQMPASRRRAAHQAVGRELDRIESEVLGNYEVGQGVADRTAPGTA